MSTRGKISLVLLLLAICLGALLWVGLPRYFRETKVRPAELYSVVYRQTNAFRSDDYSKAYENVSQTFQRKWPLNQFIGLARSDYSGISKSVRIEFGPIQERGEEVRVTAYFIDRSGRVTSCEYQLIQEGETWKIQEAKVKQRWSGQEGISGLRI